LDGDPHEQSDEATTLADRHAATPAPELFRDNLQAGHSDASDKEEKKAIPGGTYVDPDYTPKKASVLDKLNPFPKKSASE